MDALHLQQSIGTASSSDGRRLLTVKAEGPELHVLDHRLDSVQVLSGAAGPQSASTTDAALRDLCCVRAVHAHIDDEDRFLVAASSSGSRAITFWQEPRASSLFQVKGRSSWRVHSTLMLSGANEGSSSGSGTGCSITSFDVAVRKLPVPRDDALRLSGASRGRDVAPVRTQVLVLVGSTSSISLWSLPDSGGAPTWRQEWSRPTPAPIVCASLTQDASLAAAFVRADCRAMVWSVALVSEKLTVRLIDRVEHSRPLVSLEWRKPAEGPSARSDPLLITNAEDGCARIWATVIDQPLQFRLWCSVMPSLAAPRRPGITSAKTKHNGKGKLPERVFYLGAQETTMAFRAHMWELEKEIMRAELGVEDFDLPNPVAAGRADINSTPAASTSTIDADADADALAKQRRRDRDRDARRTRLQRLQQIVAETPDIFLTVHTNTTNHRHPAARGTLELTAVANVDRSPPTLFQSMTLSHALRLPAAARGGGIGAPAPPIVVVSARFVPMLTPASIATLSPREDGRSRATAELVLLVDDGGEGGGRELRYALTPGLLFDGDVDGLKLKSIKPFKRRGRSVVGEGDEVVLPLSHPKMLRLAIFWGDLELARQSILGLVERIQATDPEDEVDSPRDPGIQRILAGRSSGLAAQATFGESEKKQLQQARDDLAELAPSRRISGLEAEDIPEILRLVDVIRATDERRKALDFCGQKFVTALQQALLPFGQDEAKSKTSRPRRICLSGADGAWAAHSQHQAKLIQHIEDAHGGRLTWNAASGTSLFLWLRGPPETIRQHAESIARAQYTGGGDDEDQHDPTRCSMLYYALGKHKLVLSLWRQAAWHPDQRKMITFLSNDFTEERWRTAALKNAFALMSKRKFELAGAFFLLGGSLRDATNVCVRNLEDVELAIAVARVAEGRDDGPVLQSLLRTKLLPLAFERGDRGLASLGLDLLGEAELERQVLIAPSLRDFVGQNEKMRDVLGDALPTFQTAAPDTVDASGELSSALLYNHLQAQTGSAASRGPSEAEQAQAKEAVLRQARDLRRQGCDLFALRLVLDWTFPPPPVPRKPVANGQTQHAAPAVADLDAAPARSEDDLARLPDALKAKLRAPPAAASSDGLSSALWDSFGGAAATAAAAPAPPAAAPVKAAPDPPSAPAGNEAAKPAKKTGLGTLMKPTSTMQVEQGATEFSMSAFGF